jgi:hypothetical protein
VSEKPKLVLSFAEPTLRVRAEAARGFRRAARRKTSEATLTKAYILKKSIFRKYKKKMIATSATIFFLSKLTDGAYIFLTKIGLE